MQYSACKSGKALLEFIKVFSAISLQVGLEMLMNDEHEIEGIPKVRLSNVEAN